MGLANVYAALLAGSASLTPCRGWGCRLPGRKGNVATEDVVMLCESISYHTGLSMPGLLQAVELLADMIGAPQGGGPTRGFLSSAPDLNRAVSEAIIGRQRIRAFSVIDRQQRDNQALLNVAACPSGPTFNRGRCTSSAVNAKLNHRSLLRRFLAGDEGGHE